MVSERRKVSILVLVDVPLECITLQKNISMKVVSILVLVDVPLESLVNVPNNQTLK